MGVDTTLVGSSSTRASNILELSGFDDPDSYKVVISQDSGVVAEYARFDKMPAEIELEAGAYSVEVSKGTKTAAAFNSPYFYGKQDFTIVKDMTTPVEVTAAMENSRVTVDFSDDFVATYKDYTLSFMTNKMTLPLVYEKGEYRPMYFQADASGTKLTIGMELVNVYGKDVQYTATTTIKQKQWTKLTVRTDEKGLNGVAIDVVLNDETKETVYVNIGIPDFMEKLKGAPYISSEVFHWDDTNESMEEPSECTKEECSASATVDVTAGGKVNQVLLTLKDASNTVIINQYDLVNLTDEQAKYLKDSFGFELSENELKKGSMSGLIDLKAIISALPGKIEESYYELSLTVVDAMPIPNTTTKTVKITVPKVGDNSIDWGNFPSDAEYASFSEDQVVEMTVPAGIKAATISIDGLDIKEQDINTPINGISVKKEADKVSLTFTKEWFNSLSFNEDKTPKKYTITLNVIDNLDRTIDNNSRSFKVNAPLFAWAEENAVDAFAKYVFLKIQTHHPENVTFYGNGQQIESENIVTLENSKTLGVVTFVLKNLNSATSYEISAKYNNDDKLVLETKEFTTESVGSLPNAGFENWYSNKIDENGKDLTTIKWKDYVYWNKWYPWNEEDENSKGWNTLNLTTTQYGGEPSMYNIWPITKPTPPYVGCCYTTTSGTMPTTDKYLGDYAALIRTVGWGKGNTAAGSIGTCEQLTPGELYLGTYNLETHSASYDGFPLNSRPFAISFAYKYVPKNSVDWGLVIIEVKDASGNSLVKEEKQIFAQSSYIVETIKLNYTLLGKATKILVSFKSSGNSACWERNEDNLTYPSFGDLSTGEYVGSQLYIDDVELIYDYE